MGQGNIGKLPKLGEITVPVHLMHYDDRKNPKKQFSSNFCFWKAADGASDVTNDDGQEIGTIGGTMGGHVEMNRYYPSKDRTKEHAPGGTYEQWIEVIIDVRDMWNQIEALLDTPGTKVIIDGLEEIHEKYQEMKTKERKTKEENQAAIDEIRQMQREAEEEETKKKELAQIAQDLIKSKEDAAEELRLLKIAQEDAEKTKNVKYWINKTGIIEDGGWDLTKKIEDSDFRYIEDGGGIIPKNYGMGAKILNDQGRILNSPVPDKVREVELRISTWMGTSPGAIHYYGSLNFDVPWPYYEDEPTSSTVPWDLHIFGTNKIELTHPIEAWEIREHRENYKGWRVGDNYRGFYTVDAVIKAGQEFFDEYFAKGWKLKITEL